MFRDFLLLLPSLVCFFWAVTLVVDWKRNYRAQNIWAIVLLVGTVNSFYWTYMAVEDHSLLSKLPVLVSFTHAGFYALLCLFYRALTDRRPFTWKDYAVLIPPLLMGFLFTVCTFILGSDHFVVIMGEERKEFVVSISRLTHTVQYLIGAHLNNVLAILYINILLVLLILWKVRGEDRYDEMPVRKVVGGLFVFLSCMLAFLVGEYLYFIEHYIPFYVLFAVQGGIFYFISFQVYHLRKVRH